MSDNELIRKTNAFQLELDCPRIKLTQRAVENPIVFNGSGTVLQESDGHLVLKLCHMLTESQGMLDSDVDTKYHFDGPGKIISDKHYFDMECCDTYGRTWVANKLHLENDFFSQTRSVIIRAKIKNIVREYERAAKDNCGYIDYYVPYSVDLPCNKAEKYGNGGSRLSIYKLEIDGVVVELNNADNQLQIYSELPEHVNDEVFGEGLLYALSILVGRPITPVIKIHTKNGKIIMYVVSVDIKNNKSLPRPIRSIIPYPSINPSNFISQFVGKYVTEQENMKDLIGYWHKVYCSYGSSIEVLALTLTTSIEGLFDKYFKEYRENESQYVDLINDSIKKINECDINADVKANIKSTLGGYKRKSVKNALKAYVLDNKLYENTPKTWSELRNQSAHADSLDGSYESTQKYFDKYYICLGLFYLIILDVVNYKGERIMYNREGWPNTDKMA